MNNLHRSLAPVSDAAWAEISEEVTRTFRRRIAGRRVVDVTDPAGLDFAGIGTGHLEPVAPVIEGVTTSRRVSLPAYELRVPFTVARAAVDSVERGAVDADWDPAKDAAAAIAAAEDRLVFSGSDALGITGVMAASSNERVPLPGDVEELPTAVSEAMNLLRLAGVEGPFALLLSAELYTLVQEETDDGYPVAQHLTRMLGEGAIIWAPAIEDAVLLSTRGGDFELHLGQDLSIGYLGHDADTVTLYLQESLTFRVCSDEASVVIGR